jgi:hypothetical protein
VVIGIGKITFTGSYKVINIICISKIHFIILGKIKAIYRVDRIDYTEYTNPEEAVILYENFYTVKRLFGIPIYKKRVRNNTNFSKKRNLTKTGFK